MTMTKYDMIKSITLKEDPGRRIVHVARDGARAEREKTTAIMLRQNIDEAHENRSETSRKTNEECRKTHGAKLLVSAHTLMHAQTHKSNVQAQ